MMTAALREALDISPEKFAHLASTGSIIPGEGNVTEERTDVGQG